MILIYSIATVSNVIYGDAKEESLKKKKIQTLSMNQCTEREEGDCSYTLLAFYGHRIRQTRTSITFLIFQY